MQNFTSFKVGHSTWGSLLKYWHNNRVESYVLYWHHNGRANAVRQKNWHSLCNDINGRADPDMFTDSTDVSGSTLPLYLQYINCAASAGNNHCFQATETQRNCICHISQNLDSLCIDINGRTDPDMFIDSTDVSGSTLPLYLQYINCTASAGNNHCFLATETQKLYICDISQNLQFVCWHQWYWDTQEL